MKKITFIFILINLALVFANSNNPPMLPDNIYGTANINFEPMPVNTIIFAEINENIVGTITTIELGNYGAETNIENKFLISGYTFDIGENIEFYIEIDQNKIYAITEPEIVIFEGGNNKEIMLNFNYEEIQNPSTDNIYGQAFINSNPAAINTEIFANINGVLTGYTKIIETGIIGSDTNISNSFLISGQSIDVGENIEFYIEIDQNKIYAITEPEIIIFEGNVNKEITLNFNYEITNPPILPPEEPSITPPSTPPSNSGGGGSSSVVANNIVEQNISEIEENLEDSESTEINGVSKNINLNPPHSPADGNLTFLTEKSKNIDGNININTVEKLKNNDSYLIYIIIGIITTIIIIITIKKIKE
jgi:hypothetical protein